VSADPPYSVPVDRALPATAILPGDPYWIRRYMTERQAEQAAYEPLPPVPEEPSQ
jgi:hypothetical protein